MELSNCDSPLQVCLFCAIKVMHRYLLSSTGRGQTQRLECRNCHLINNHQCCLWCSICGKIRFRIPFHILTFHPIPTIFIFHTCAEHQRVSKKIGEISPVSKVWRKSLQFVCLFHLSRILNVFIGPESDHWECLSLTDSLSDSLLFSKLD